MSENRKELSELQSLRNEIDHIDNHLLELFSKRASIAKKIASVKQLESGDKKPLFYRPKREAEIMRRMVDLNPGPLSPEAIQRFFREVMSSCLSLQQPVKVAYLGPEGTFTQQAALNYFGGATDIQSCVSIDDVFREVASGNVHYGVVPVENSIEGFVNLTLDNFFLSPQKICGEVIMRIHHNLLVSKKNTKQKITKIYAHSQALAQCRQWLDRNYPGVERIPVASNGEAARRLENNVKGEAAIASDLAAKLYNLEIMASKIEDRHDNSTRFLVLGNQQLSPTGHDKTSIIIVSPDEPGSLHRILAPFHCYGINLTKLESRPVKGNTLWRYAFFIDFDGHMEDAKVKQVIREIKNHAVDVNCLGSYPRVMFS